jgi:uncharacterized membrane protein YfcA
LPQNCNNKRKGKDVRNLKKRFVVSILGFLAGIMNGLLGAGGGLIVVPLLKHYGLPQQKAQATAISIILPLTVISTIIYYINGNIPLDYNLWFIPFGALGAVIGAFLLPKISNKILKNIFAAFIIWAGIRLLLK